MERIENLVNKLKEQADRQADPRQLLVTVQLLQQELVQLIGNNKNLGTSKVSVVVPNTSVFPSGFEKYAPRPQEQQAVQPQPVEKEQPAPAPEPVASTPAPQPAPKPAPQPAHQLKPPPQPEWQPEPAPEPAPQPEEKIYFTLEEDDTQQEEEPETEPGPLPQPKTPAKPADFDPLTEIPTLSQQVQTPAQPERPAATVNSDSSLNDRLRQDSGELQQRLQGTPIKDLRKAIGINDRFRFINELFRGDEVMYERSIKTINNFNIYPEAEYWISRELKVKLGWDIDSEAVLIFDQLVKRRFA
jgi:hypothetical protein